VVVWKKNGSIAGFSPTEVLMAVVTIGYFVMFAHKEKYKENCLQTCSDII